MSDAGAPHGRRPDARGHLRGEPADAPQAGTSEPLADPSGTPTEGGAVEADASEDGIWLASAGYQLVQRRQAAERQRARVLAEARAHRRDLTPDAFEVLADQGYPLTVPFEARLEDVLAYLDGFRPTSAPTSPKSWRQLRLEQALEGLRQAGDVAPTQATVADAISPPIAERTLRGWLAAEPDLRALLPQRPRNR
jgi:hypothetical protein